MPIHLIETHISWVFLAGDRAYKIKKPVRMPFLDYRSLEARRRFCVEEVLLNRRLAPDLYLGVRTLVQRSDGTYELAGADAANAVEYVVEMRRIDPGRVLAAAIEASAVTDADIDAVAERIARFHAEATRAAKPALFREQLESTLESLEEHLPGASARLADAVRQLHRDCEEELAARERGGLVRDGHGDLRAEHVVLGEPVQIFDCVEFDPRLREIDVGADLGFLVMDLERIGAHDAAARLIRVYREHGGDPGSEHLLDLFCAYRACVRASVGGLRAEQLEGAERVAERAEADALARLAWRYVWRSHRPFVLAVCGPPAVGKSTLAEKLAELAELPRLSSDRVRRELAGDAPDRYSTATTLRVYRELGRRARESPRGAVVDATFRSRAERELFTRELGLREPLFVQCGAPLEVIEERARTRLEEPLRESEADVGIARRLARELEPLDEIPAERVLRVDTREPLGLLAMEIEAWLSRRRAGSRPAVALPGAAATRGGA